MKKTSKLLILSGLLAATASLVSCGTTEDTIPQDANPRELSILLVPSNDPTKLMQRATALTPYLNEYVKDTGYTFKITVGNSYDSVMTALTSGTGDAGFLPGGNYAQVSITNPGKVDLIASAVRAGYKVQADDFKGNGGNEMFNETNKELQRKAMNGEITVSGQDASKATEADPVYKYYGEQSQTNVNFYSGVMFSRRDEYSKEKNFKTFGITAGMTSKEVLAKLHDGEAVFGIMGNGSSSGLIYPSKFVYDMGYTNMFVSKSTYESMSAAEKAKSLIGINQGTYPNGLSYLMSTGVIDVSVGFMDTRYGSGYVQTGGPFANDKGIFDNTYTVGITDPIMNDTISCMHGLEQPARDAIYKAFTTAAATGDKSKDGDPAYYLYQIYSHTGYAPAKDSDYDAAREMYSWKKAHDVDNPTDAVSSESK